MGRNKKIKTEAEKYVGHRIYANVNRWRRGQAPFRLVGVLLSFDGTRNEYKIAVEEKETYDDLLRPIIRKNFTSVIKALDVCDLGLMQDAEELLTHDVEGARLLGLEKFEKELEDDSST